MTMSDERFATLLFEDVNLPWLSHLSVYLSDGHRRDTVWQHNKKTVTDDYYSTENMSCVVQSSAVYYWENGRLEAQHTTASIYSRQKTYPFTLMKAEPSPHVVIASVLFEIPDARQWDEMYISYILQHELQHVYDQFSRELSIEQMNRDIAMNVAVGYDDDVFPENKRLRFVNVNTSDATRRRIINEYEPHYSVIKDVVKYVADMLNFSELNAHLFNVIGEMKRAGRRNMSDFTYGRPDDERVRAYLIEVSPTYATYAGYRDALTALLNYSSDEAKSAYANNIMRVVYSNVTPEPDCEYPYGRSFENLNGEYDEHSTDEFLEMLIGRCDDFLNDCVELHNNAYNLAESTSKKTALLKHLNERRDTTAKEIFARYLDELNSLR